MKRIWSVVIVAVALLALLALLPRAQQAQTSTAASVPRFQLFESATEHLIYRIDTDTGQAWIHVITGPSQRYPAGASVWQRIDEPPAK